MPSVYDALIDAAALDLDRVMRQAGRASLGGTVTVWAVPPDHAGKVNGFLAVTSGTEPPPPSPGGLPSVVRPRGLHSRWDAIPFRDYRWHLWESARSAPIMPLPDYADPVRTPRLAPSVNAIADDMGGTYRPGVIIAL